MRLRLVAVAPVGGRGGAAGGDLHGLGLLLVGDLGDGGAGLDLLLVVLVGAHVSLDGPRLLAAGGGGLGVAELVVLHALDVEADRVGAGLHAGHAHLGVDGGVGGAAVQLGRGLRVGLVAVAAVRGAVGVGLGHRSGQRRGGQQKHEEILERKTKVYIALIDCRKKTWV